jgi:iron complex transport system ATP-binding protein
MNSFSRGQTVPLLELRNVRVMRGEKIVLDDLNFRVDVNEHVAVLGPNGCGKSTLIKTITRECYPVVRKSSSMAILGEKSWNIFELRSLLGIVSNDLIIVHRRYQRPRCRALRLLQQHPYLSESHD